MAKKLLSVWLSLTIFLFSSISIYADEVVQSDFFLKNIVINGESIVNYQLDNPFLIYDDRVYIPMDTEIGNIMGFEAEMDHESRTLKILKTDPVQRNVSDRSVKNNLEQVSATVRTDIQVVAYTEEVPEQAEIQSPRLDAHPLDLMGQPLLVRDGVVYVPLNTMASGGAFGWTTHYETYFGICVSTDAGTEAYSYYSAAESDRVRGLASYIVSQNSSLAMFEAANMVRYFEAYGAINGVDPQLLMAVANCESMYHPEVVNSSNCVGLMQIKVSTGNSYGFTKEQLLQVKPNIEMGSIYLGEALAEFGGDRVKALSSYNWGIWGVKKGSYNTKYADKVLSRYSAIDSFLRAGGYV